MTSTLRSFLFGLTALALALPLRAAVQLINLIEDNSPVVLYVRDIPAFMKNGADSPWAKTWNDEQMRKFTAPLRAKMKVERWDEQCKAETGHTVDELLAMAKGQMIAAVTSPDIFDLGDDPDPSKIPLLFAIEIGGDAAKIAKIIAESDEKKRATVRTEDYAGVQLHVYQKDAEKGGGDQFLWAMVDGIWFISPSKVVLQKAIDNLKNGRASAPLGESERFLSVKKQAADADLVFYCNIQSVYPALKQAADKSAEKKGQSMPPGLVMDALGLDALRDLYVTVTLSADGTQLDGGLTCSERKGFFKMLAFNDGPVSQPDFVSEKWVNAGTTCFSLPATYGALKEFLTALNPMIASMMQGRIKELNQQLGIDIEQDLVGSIGGNIIVGKALRPGANADTPPPLSELDQLVAVSLNNSTAFNKAVEAIKRMAGPQVEKMFNKREFLGQSIFTFSAPNQGAEQKMVSYAITSKYLFVAVGTPAILETALRGLDGKQPSLWKKPEVKALLAEIPANACSFEYQDNRLLIGSMIETLSQIGTQFASRTTVAADEDEGGGPVRSTEGPFDLSAKPDSAALGKYWSNSSGYAWIDSNGLYFKSKVQHPK